MEQYCGTPKLATYLHPGPTGPFLELKNEPMKPPSPSTSALLQHNPSLIDLCTFNSICQRLVENSSTSNTSPYKPLVTPSDLFFCLPTMTQIDDSNETDTKPNIIPDTTASPISSAGECSPNVSSCTSTPYSSPKVTHTLQQNSPLDLCVTKDSYKLPTKIEITNGHDDIKPIKEEIHTSPILHRLLTSPSKLNDNLVPSNQNDNVVSSNQNDYVNNDNNKSPQYRPRYSPFYKPETKNLTKDNFNK
jgi:hypothetical protein